MFDGSRSRPVWPVVLLAAALVGGVVAVVVFRPAVIERLGVLVGGGNPLADPFASGSADHLYPESPLAVSLELEAGFAEVEVEQVLAFADALAHDLGFWLLARTGAASVDEAERALWAEPGGPDAFGVAWAVRLQNLQVHARDTQRLSSGVKAEGFRYVHPDELALLLAHVAWRLDLGLDLVRSPVHLYLLWREPGGDRRRGIEPTCFRRVDALGHAVPSQEPSVGRLLLFSQEHYPSGVGGIRNPKPLPSGAYEVVHPAALTGELLVRLVDRYGGGLEKLEARLGAEADDAVAHAVHRIRLAAGLAAWERGDLAGVRREATALGQLRAAHGDRLPSAPDEAALEAAVAFADGDVQAGLAAARRVSAHHEPTSEPLLFARSDAHAAAMWLELEHGKLGMSGWNRRVVPLLNRYRERPERIAALCGMGRRVLTDAEQTVEELVPECRG